MRRTCVFAALVVAMATLGGACSNEAPGAVKVTVGLAVERCPLLSSWTASPLQATAPDGTISVSVAASETLDAGALSYAWTATAGTFNTPDEASALYRCVTAGAQTLTATVMNTHRHVPCVDIIEIPVTCKSAPR
jgi:hypothetical protein